MLVTIDTNIIYQAMRSSRGASFAILQLVRNGRIRIAISHPVLLEYEDVLTRPSSLESFNMVNNDIQKVLQFIAYVSEKFEPKYLFRPNLKDENDNIFVELAVVSQSKYLITNNIKDFRNSELKFDCFTTLTPSDFLKTWRKYNGTAWNFNN